MIVDNISCQQKYRRDFKLLDRTGDRLRSRVKGVIGSRESVKTGCEMPDYFVKMTSKGIEKQTYLVNKSKVK